MMLDCIDFILLYIGDLTVIHSALLTIETTIIRDWLRRHAWLPPCPAKIAKFYFRRALLAEIDRLNHFRYHCMKARACCL